MIFSEKTSLCSTSCCGQSKALVRFKFLFVLYAHLC